MSNVSIIIVNFNHSTETIECVQSLQESTYQDFDIIIIDNASSEEDYRNLCQQLFTIPKITIIKSDTNNGFAAGCNIGIRYALANTSSKYFWLLNNDTLVKKDTLENLVRCAEKSPPTTGIIGNKLLFPDNKIQAIGGIYIPYKAKGIHLGAGEIDHGQYDKNLDFIERKINYIVGASMFVKREFIESVGLMCEDYFLFFEEIDWVLRGRKKDWRIGYCPGAAIIHKESATLKDKANPTELQKKIYYYSMRNKLLFTKKFYPQFLPLIYFRLLLQVIKEKEKNPWRIPILLAVIKGKAIY